MPNISGVHVCLLRVQASCVLLKTHGSRPFSKQIRQTSVAIPLEIDSHSCVSRVTRVARGTLEQAESCKGQTRASEISGMSS